MTVLKNSDNLLFQSIRSNALYSSFCGLVAAAASGPVAQFLGLPSGGRIALILIGIGLILHGALLWFGSQARPVDQTLAWYAIIGDIGWVVISILILFIDPWQFSNGGWWLIAILADIVALFAILQYIGLRRMKR